MGQRMKAAFLFAMILLPMECVLSAAEDSFIKRQSMSVGESPRL
jgi:hypothetical protein